MIKSFDKLVRDKLPSILEFDHNVSGFSHYSTFNPEKINQYAKQKLVEEAKEVLEASTQKEVLAELGDLYEIMLKVAEVNGIKPHQIIEAASDKAKKYGTFNSNVILKEISYK